MFCIIVKLAMPLIHKILYRLFQSNVIYKEYIYVKSLKPMNSCKYDCGLNLEQKCLVYTEAIRNIKHDVFV